jgi:hypothetical protein
VPLEVIVKGGTLKPPFTLGVRVDVQPKSSIPIGAKVEISPEGFTLGIEAELENIFSICPKVINECLNFMASYWPQG